MDWNDTTAIVTGAASGIGRAAALELASRGVNVLAFDIDTAGLAEISSTHITAHEVDISDRDAVHSTIAAAVPGGRLDFVVNCAATFVARGLDVTTADWELSLGVNVRGMSNVVQAAHPFLVASPHGAVVNTSSISANIAQPSRWTYNATKGAIVTLTKCMALDLSVDKIRVNSVSPGWIWTPEVARAAEVDRETWEPVWGRFHMLRRLGEASEVAKAIAFLCSTDASFITGADLPVDGGYSAMGPEGLGESSSFAGSS